MSSIFCSGCLTLHAKKGMELLEHSCFSSIHFTIILIIELGEDNVHLRTALLILAVSG